MTTFIEAEKLKEPEFAWGKKRGIGGKNKDVQFYETFAYDGEDYALYDDVFMQNDDEPEPYIGKLVKIWKNSDGSKRVKLQWFFRPREISNYLGDAELIGNELFFASGDGIGLSSINPLDAIVGKCNIVCISKDGRNPQPSAEELQGSHYVFYLIFDVKSCTISDRMDDKVGGIEVKYVFNRTKILKHLDAVKLNLTGNGEEEKLIAENSVQLLNNVIPEENNDQMAGKEVTDVKEMTMKQGRLHGSSSGVCVKSGKVQIKMEEGVTRDAVDAWKVESRIFEVTRRTIIGKSNLMKLSWESKMKAAHDKGTLLLLQNLDPEYTSEEVEDIVFHAFKEESTVKTLQHTSIYNPYSGQAFVILKSRETLDRIMKILNDRCLMLPNQRPLVSRTLDFPKFLEKPTFVGDLTAYKFRHHSKRDNADQEAVATSHYSQNNTVEYEMAMAWCHLQLRSDRWWNMLYEKQRKEMQKLANKLKPKTKYL